LIIIDGTVVWSLNNGSLRRIYQWPGQATKDTRTPLGLVGAVTKDGTAYIAPEDSPGVSTLGKIIGIHADGTTTSLALPDTLPGVGQALGALTVFSLIPDASDGLYIRAGAGLGRQYVLHVHQGHVEIVAQSDASMDTPYTVRPEDAGTKIDALAIPVFLPITMARQPGRLVLLDSPTSIDGVIVIGIP
jgi:hypothetical protein